ncbi:MAG: 16S rRNA (cytosine(1402)-N(4))-methyltransferase RsmH [Myxococcales bacterium]|nr:16S rRNA (cytosine(1402)-N(4))-methyltransferase RsmH [Myxococcales bacterium]
MTSAHHVPVLADAVARLAAVRPGERWVDCTLGFAGHALLLLEAGARLWGVDQDPEARAHAAELLSAHADRFTLLPGNFRDLEALLRDADVPPVDGLLADVGVSSWQLDQAHRGFSFSHAGPVDMRMDPTRGETALDLLRRLEVPTLAGLLRTYGEEPFAGPIARALKTWAEGAGPHDTGAMAAVVQGALPRKAAATRTRHPATRTFQALRIAVNDELGALEALLDAIPRVLAPGGRALIITFHSLEDRLVKRTFAGWTKPAAAPRRGLPPPPDAAPAFALLTRKGETADDAEIARNPRARSARLRGVRKLTDAERRAA